VSVLNAAPPAPTPVRKTGRPKQNREAIFLFLPALLPVLLLSVYPLIRGIALGFTNARAGLNVDTNFIGIWVGVPMTTVTLLGPAGH